MKIKWRALTFIVKALRKEQIKMDKNNCNGTDWLECIQCNFIDYCDKKEKNRIGILIMLKDDIKRIYKKGISKIKKQLKKKNINILKKKLEDEEGNLRLQDWKRYSEPEKYLYDDSELLS